MRISIIPKIHSKGALSMGRRQGCSWRHSYSSWRKLHLTQWHNGQKKSSSFTRLLVLEWIKLKIEKSFTNISSRKYQNSHFFNRNIQDYLIIAIQNFYIGLMWLKLELMHCLVNSGLSAMVLINMINMKVKNLTHWYILLMHTLLHLWYVWQIIGSHSSLTYQILCHFNLMSRI